MKSLVLIAAILISSGVNAQPTLRSLWRARALDAVDRLKEMKPRVEAAVDAEKRRLVVASQIEWAFASLLDEKLDAFTYQKSDGAEAFRLAFKSDAGDLFAITYVYKADRETPIIRINALPHGWGAMLMPLEGRVAVAVGPEDGEFRYVFFDFAPFEPVFEWSGKPILGPKSTRPVTTGHSQGNK